MRFLFAFSLACSLLLAGCSLSMPTEKEIATNPDPNHTHADFAIWVRNEKIDLSSDKYMSHSPDAAETLDETAHQDEHDALNEYLHLHDGVGTVVHRHKPGLSFGEFLGSLGFTLTSECLITDTEEMFCNTPDEEWEMMVNGEEQEFTPNYVFTDLDKILITYGATLEQKEEQWAQISDDACLYSQTCPERGTPPVENCIADPEIPCVLPPEA